MMSLPSCRVWRGEETSSMPSSSILPPFPAIRRGEAFQVQKDFDRLIMLAHEVAAPGANILLSVNHSAMRVADLERSARGALKIAVRSGRFIVAAPLSDFPPGHGAKTVWLEVR